MSEERNIPIDVALFQSLESKSAELSSQFMAQVENIQKQLKQMTQSTTEAEHVYNLSVKNLANEIDSSTKKTVELITHCDELDKDLAQLSELSRQVKSVNKALDQLQQMLSQK
ncbi:uncharacterized protein ATC70_008313 [Mucor velutinosus]|uniref:BLOC-1-related complex subunit 6 C-terminal helix domain-containing protein n=1 Tax=Mucor velutinosus TaxID=708070 RepID=A0AAN7DNG1_9FUNG|nr:hypothetical protein ATC70_008313 [Mucor velutinosus]